MDRDFLVSSYRRMLAVGSATNKYRVNNHLTDCETTVHA
jgi:hypothetical protein